MRLNATDISTEGKTLACIRCDQIGGAGGLWWVAQEFDDGTTKPEGMYASETEARALAGMLANDFGVMARVNLA